MAINRGVQALFATPEFINEREAIREKALALAGPGHWLRFEKAARAWHGHRWLALAAALAVLLIAGLLWQGLAWNDNPRPGTEAGGTPSIAIMAFTGPAGDPDADALARDVAADLVAELARSPGLRAARRSLATFRVSVPLTGSPSPSPGRRPGAARGSLQSPCFPGSIPWRHAIKPG